ncbi:Frag1/DRAM/Sfk1 [Aspergillus filifer]
MWTKAWALPLVSAVIWLFTLLAMIGYWFSPDTPAYTLTRGQTIPFVSDVGAREMKPVFILGSWISVILLNAASFFKHRPTPPESEKGKWRKDDIDQTLDYILTSLTATGSAGLILLTHFDRLNHPDLHRAFLVLYVFSFSLGAAVGCLACLRQCMLARWRHRVLIITLVVRACIGGVCAILGLAFWLAWTHPQVTRDFCAVIEWALAFTFSGHIACFAAELLPSYSALGAMGGYMELR